MLKERTLPLVGSSVEETLKNILSRQDILDLRTDKSEEFEKSLIKEVRFLGLYDKGEIDKVEQYIHEHSFSLYQFALHHVS